MPEIMVRTFQPGSNKLPRARWISIENHDAESFYRRCMIELACDVGTQLRYQPSPDIPKGLVSETRISPVLWAWVKHRDAMRAAASSRRSTEVRSSSSPDRRTLDHTGLFFGEYEKARENLRYIVVQLAKKRFRPESGRQGDAYWTRIPADERPPKIEGYEWTSLVEESQLYRVHLDELGNFSRTEAQLLAEYLVSDYPDLSMDFDRTGYFANSVVLNVYLPVVTHVLRPVKDTDCASGCDAVESN